MSAALIVQNKGGGHGELGYQLAKELSSNPKITSITILQDEACNDKKEPFVSYAADLPDVKVIKAPLADESMTADSLKKILGDAKFEYVWDNASKAPEGAGKAICDCAKEWGVKLFTYVSSAGIYKPDGVVFPMPETTPIKETAGQALFDNYAVELGLPLVSFRPQYIYGPKANKNDYIDWYFDRLVRELPLPIPGDGTQKVSLTCSEDVASILASPLNNEEAAIEQRFFNCGTDQLVSYNEVAAMCAEAAGIPQDKVMIEHYDADMFGKATFPFRMTDFYVAPDMVKEKLGWEGAKHSLKDDVSWYYESYKARGGPEKKMSLVKDWEITVGSKTSPPEYWGTIYDKYDPLILDTSEMEA
jgi:nucleoside-diphosphate-sugar epimerase